MSKPHYIVICKNANGVYVLATHRQFHTASDAHRYLLCVAISREPIVVMVETNLRG